MRVGYVLLCACVQVCGLPFRAESVIKGWEEGVKTMCSREVALLTCKPEYAYGEKGSPPKIPANAILQFEVELLSWQGEDITTKKDGGVRRIILERGSNTDYYKPKEGAAVKGLFRREGRGESCTRRRYHGVILHLFTFCVAYPFSTSMHEYARTHTHTHTRVRYFRT